MSLLTICQNAINSVPLNSPGTIIDNSNRTALLSLACAQQEGKALMRRDNWVSLVTEHTFSTADGTIDYALPTDFDRLENDTLWDRSNFEHIRGPLTAQMWQEYKSSILSSTNTVWKRFRIRNVSGTTKFSIHPTPDAVDNLVFEYVSKNFCETSGGTGQAAWAADNDVGVLDEYLLELGVKWRLLNRLGMEYAEEREEYERQVSMAIGRDGGAPTLSISTTPSYRLLGPQNVPESGYGS